TLWLPSSRWPALLPKATKPVSLLCIPASLPIITPLTPALSTPARAPRATDPLPAALHGSPAANAASPEAIACVPMPSASAALATESALVDLLWKYFIPSPEFNAPYKTLPDTASVLAALTVASAKPVILLLFTFTPRKLLLPATVKLPVFTLPAATVLVIAAELACNPPCKTAEPALNCPVNSPPAPLIAPVAVTESTLRSELNAT